MPMWSNQQNEEMTRSFPGLVTGKKKEKENSSNMEEQWISLKDTTFRFHHKCYIIKSFTSIEQKASRKLKGPAENRKEKLLICFRQNLQTSSFQTTCISIWVTVFYQHSQKFSPCPKTTDAFKTKFHFNTFFFWCSYIN